MLVLPETVSRWLTPALRLAFTESREAILRLDSDIAALGREIAALNRALRHSRRAETVLPPGQQRLRRRRTLARQVHHPLTCPPVRLAHYQRRFRRIDRTPAEGS